MRILALLLLLVHHAIAAQSWVQLPDFPGLARDDAASFHWYDKIFVGTGMDVGFQLTNDWYAYSMTTESWEAVASLPASGRQYCNGFQLSDERGYLFGGVDANGPLNELWRYDALTNTWTQRASLPGQGRYACAVIESGDHAYICGGMLDGGTPTNEVWRYDRITDSWAQRAPMPGPGRHRAESIDHQVVGGADSLFQALDDVFAYDVLNDTWNVRPSLPEPRFGASTAEFLLFCGASSLAENHDTVFLMDWNSGIWNTTTIPSFPGGPRKGGVGSSQQYLMDIGMYFYGLGIDGPTRHKDWWMLIYATQVDELRTEQTKVYPNPTSGQLSPVLPIAWTSTTYQFIDAMGRTLKTGIVLEQEPISVEQLAPGRYTLLLEHQGQRLRAPFIKLP